MPTYEYACTACQNEWEFEQSIKDNAITECPRCHEQTAKRQISRGTGFILKGSGWYSDLYSSSSNKAPAASSSTEGGSSDAKSSDAKGSDAKSTDTKSSTDKGGKGDGGSSTPASSSGSSAPAAPAKSDASTAAA